MQLQALLDKSARDHFRLCPRQVLGVRMGLAGLDALGFTEPPTDKRLLVIVETDGCFVDGVGAATGCAVGRRTLRIEDYGKTAAVFVDTLNGRCLRVAPTPELRDHALAYAPEQADPYQAQMQAYQVMPAEEMFTITPVRLAAPLESILSRPGMRVTCERCGEEIMNEREVQQSGQTLCRACAGPVYYTPEMGA